jgi:hypothetical protein
MVKETTSEDEDGKKTLPFTGTGPSPAAPCERAD